MALKHSVEDGVEKFEFGDDQYPTYPFGAPAHLILEFRDDQITITTEGQTLSSDAWFPQTVELELNLLEQAFDDFWDMIVDLASRRPPKRNWGE